MDEAPAFRIEGRFADVAEFDEQVHAWQTEFIQLDSGRIDAELVQAGQPHVHVARAHFDTTLKQNGMAPPDAWTLAVLSERSSPIVWRNRPVERDTLLVYRPGSDIDVVSRPGFEVLTLTMSEAALQDQMQAMGLPEPRRHPRGAMRLSATLLRPLRTALTQALAPGAGAASHAQAARLGLRMLAHPAGVSPNHSQRMSVLGLALEAMRDSLRGAPTVAEIAKTVGVSPRTLRHLFHQHLGVAPKRYLHSQRLDGLRRGLERRSSATTRVADVAAIWGFWHMGQLARDYRERYGERPSDTLRRTP